MASRLLLTPYSAEFPDTNFAALLTVNSTERRPVLAFDATTDEAAMWTAVVPQGFTGTVTAHVYYMMASATSGDVVWAVTVEAVTDGDTLDLDAASGYGTVNTATAATVPGTAGYLDVVSVTLSNLDSAAAGDYLRIKLTRDADNGSDTAAGDAYALCLELRDSA